MDVLEFFDPENPKVESLVQQDQIDHLLAQYEASRSRLERLAQQINNTPEVYLLVERTNSIPNMVRALNAQYWARAINLTDLLTLLPTKDREEWNRLIRENKTPDFTEKIVRETLTDLWSKRFHFLAKKAEGVFENLSGRHVTNGTEGFRKRMILHSVLLDYGESSHKIGTIHDLRSLIGWIMKRGEVQEYQTSSLIRDLRSKRKFGEWVSIDGGAIQIRIYRVGTVHIQIHEDLAWRLNMMLAQLHPQAIPAKFRTRSVKRSAWTLQQQLLPFPVLACLGQLRLSHEFVYEFGYIADKSGLPRAKDILRSLGGVEEGEIWVFEYPVGPILDRILNTGTIPETKSHQFYETSDDLARHTVELAGIEPTDKCLEPSAGHGAIAVHLPPGSTCVEVSEFRCEVLRNRTPQHQIVQGDFLDQSWPGGFDRVVMNPPFSKGRVFAHIEHAWGMCRKRLVAIVPRSLRNDHHRRLPSLFPGGRISWVEDRTDKFGSIHVSVSILQIDRV